MRALHDGVRVLHDVETALNNEPTRLTGKKPVDAIKTSSVAQKPFLPAGCTIGLKEPLLPSNSSVRYLYASSPGEHELKGGRRRATDLVWSLRGILFAVLYGIARSALHFTIWSTDLLVASHGKS